MRKQVYILKCQGEEFLCRNEMCALEEWPWDSWYIPESKDLEITLLDKDESHRVTQPTTPEAINII